MNTNTQTETTAAPVVKRGRGRPKGSKNKPKAAVTSAPTSTILKKDIEVKTVKNVVPANTHTSSPKVRVVVNDAEPTVESVE